MTQIVMPNKEQYRMRVSNENVRILARKEETRLVLWQDSPMRRNAVTIHGFLVQSIPAGNTRPVSRFVVSFDLHNGFTKRSRVVKTGLVSPEMGMETQFPDWELLIALQRSNRAGVPYQFRGQAYNCLIYGDNNKLQALCRNNAVATALMLGKISIPDAQTMLRPIWRREARSAIKFMQSK